MDEAGRWIADGEETKSERGHWLAVEDSGNNYYGDQSISCSLDDSWLSEHGIHQGGGHSKTSRLGEGEDQRSKDQ